MLGIRDCVQVTQDKTKCCPRGWPSGKPGEGSSLMHFKSTNHTTNQRTCKQVNSFSQLGLWVLGSRGPGTVSRRGSALSALQSPCPASPAVPSASGLCLSLHCLIHSSPQLPPPFHTQARCFFSSELFSDIGH